ncbi:MAG: sigma-70 family RNA polymerase sigma factor [Deltaproteobacteria bacterium]|nr:MAG: sigma-70 family RNA polymerase sigma factor [Deltaproteobacteria bacterium]
MEASRALGPIRHTRPLDLAVPRRKPASDRAFEQMYRRHAREVYQYALALLTNPADAEDVTQTTFLNAYRAFQRGERPIRPHNWLIAIAHNVCRMRWRQAGHRPREVALDDAPEPVALEHDETSIDAVLEALAQLTFSQRAAIVMRELEGRSCNEIAEILDLSVGAVESLLFRARRRMQLHRRSLGVLGTVPLPGSLGSAFGLGGGGAAAVGGAAIGADVTLKAVALLAAGAITAGAVAVAGPALHHHAPAQPARAVPVISHSSSAGKSASPRKRPQARTSARTATRARSHRIAPQPAPTIAPTREPQPNTGAGQGQPAIQPPTLPAPPALPKPPELPKPPAIPPIPPIPPLPIAVPPPIIPPLPIK